MSPADLEDQSNNPVDVVERLAAVHEWSFARSSDDEVTLMVAGRWTDYQVSFTWMPEIEALHLACAFDLKVPERRRAEVTELVALVNEQLWVGHFDAWFKDGIIMFRHALVLTGGITAADAQCEALLGMAAWHLTPASVTMRLSNSCYGRARALATRFNRPCSKPAERREPETCSPG